MHIAINAPNIAKENKNGGLWNRRIKKSVAKILVRMGWSINPLIIFLNMSIPSSTLKNGASV
jgi:hypothetical protein